MWIWVCCRLEIISSCYDNQQFGGPHFIIGLVTAYVINVRGARNQWSSWVWLDTHPNFGGKVLPRNIPYHDWHTMGQSYLIPTSSQRHSIPPPYPPFNYAWDQEVVYPNFFPITLKIPTNFFTHTIIKRPGRKTVRSWFFVTVVSLLTSSQLRATDIGGTRLAIRY